MSGNGVTSKEISQESDLKQESKEKEVMAVGVYICVDV